MGSVRKNPVSTKTVKKILKGMGIAFLSSVALAIALAGYLVISHHRSLVLPSPTGPYSIARTEYDWMAGYIGSIRPERGLEISNAYLVAFFDRYLKGMDSELLQGPSLAYPEVQFEQR